MRTISMARPRTWSRVPARSVDQHVYGRTVYALSHRSGALLLHRKNVSRNSRHYHSYGQWLVVVGREVVRSKTYFNSKEMRKPPTRWAAHVLRLHAAGVYEAERRAVAFDSDSGGVSRDQCHRCRNDGLDLPSAGEVGLERRCEAAACSRSTDPTKGTQAGPDGGKQTPGAGSGDQLIWHPPGFDELPKSLAPMAKRCQSIEGWRRKVRRSQRSRTGQHRRTASKAIAA